MSYKHYLASEPNLAVRKSDVESSASGLAIGRLEVWPPRASRGRDVVDLIEASGFDVVIVRASAEDVELAAALNTESLISWQADTLLYFEIASKNLSGESVPDSLVRLTLSEGSYADMLVARIFASYRNHYLATPALRKIKVVNAYQNWTRNMMVDANHLVFKAMTTNGAAAGLSMIDISDESYDEILLAGVLPEERGRGAYQNMLRLIGVKAKEAGKEKVVISSQAANIRVLRAWCRLGFLPSVALNTIHVVRRDVHRASLGDPMSTSLQRPQRFT